MSDDPRPRASRGGILAGPIDGSERLASAYAACEATPGLKVVHRSSGFSGELVGLDGTVAVIRGATGLERRVQNAPGAFLVASRPVRLVPATAAREPDAPAHLADARISAKAVTASGSRTVIGAKARVARASRIVVEGVHDAELVEKVWGDDLRIEGIVVERLDGLDHLDAALTELAPGPGRRIGVLVDHLVPGSKEMRIVQTIRNPHVLVTGTPYVDVWEAVKPSVLGFDAWPVVPKGQDWKTGVCAALGAEHPGLLWRRILDATSTWKHLEQPFIRAVEELIDFVTEPEASDG